jgi:hypothetical protein
VHFSFYHQGIIQIPKLGKKPMKYLSFAICVSSALLSITVLAAPISIAPNSKVQAQPQVVTASNLICADQKIVIQTTCMEKEPDLPYCPVQTVSFSSPKNSKIVAFRHEFNGGNQPFIVGAECHVKNSTSFVLLRNTNFGNCQVCEWTDVFSAEGKYLGSNEGMFKGESFKRHQLNDKETTDILMTEKFKKSETEFIARTVQK